MRRGYLIKTIFILLCSLNLCSLSPAEVVQIPDKIRVVIAEDLTEAIISIRGTYRITTLETQQHLKDGKTIFNIKITCDEYGIRFGKDYFKIYAIEIRPDKEPAVYFGKRLYKGTLQIIRTKEGSLRLINLVTLDDYLKGVLYHEVSHRWPLETIKAQAIVSRTFALYQAQQNKDKYHHLRADVSSQVYGGVYAYRYKTNKAVEQTNGQVLYYNGELLPAFFHATCGGRTEDVSQLWKLKMKPLKGVLCPFCRNSPHFSWSRNIPLKEIEAALKDAGYQISRLNSMRVKGRDTSRRVKDIVLKTADEDLIISAKDFRQTLGPSLIKSTNFSIEIKDGAARFTGRGWGHGVGMCQWGAFAMAKKRKNAYQILRHYYPGASLVRLD